MDHICGLYYTTDPDNVWPRRHYLPQVKLDSHTSITPVCFTTTLKQTFSNPNNDAVDQVRYCFPFYDGVAVGGYTITFGDKVLTGVVKQKDVAKQTYQAAVDRGETAGLLESLPAGIFGVTLGNLPAKTDVLVEITYCGELKHDAGIDGLRYTLPTSIAPRYGSYPGQVVNVNAINSGGISITVDLDMGKSAIRKAQSPSHPIAVSMGATSAADGGIFNPSKASATLTLGSTELADDFVLQLIIDDIPKPQAIIESHPVLPTRALMATLVPKFSLEPHHPEIVFIADQSGSMSGSKNEALVAALKVFLKSLPLGVRFNICAFGNSFKFLWDKSEAYNESNVKTALNFLSSFHAAYGGTEILNPIKEAFKRRLKDMPLEIMLLTDGEIWQENQVFTYINAQVHGNHANARVFGLGIGSDVSHTLVEGVARAGNGFAQFVTQNEETDRKVIRMLKGALYPHTKDWSLEVHYGSTSDAMNDEKNDEDDFEIIEKVKDCLVINDAPSQTRTKDTIPTTAKPVSLFDTSADLDRPTQDPKADRYAHLPAIDTPKLLQAPSNIPPLFPFSRTAVYLLLGPDTPQRDVKAITLRGTALQGPLELTIDVSASDNTGSTIHQLAAKKAIQDLEEGRGWLQAATASDGVLLKTKYESRFDEIVEREAARLGEMFQVAGKWTSFVAVEGNRGEDPAKQDVSTVELEAASHVSRPAPRRQLASKAARRSVGLSPTQDTLPEVFVSPAVLAQYQSEMAEAACMPLPNEDDLDEPALVLTSASQAPSSGGFACRVPTRNSPKSAIPPPPPPPYARAAAPSFGAPSFMQCAPAPPPPQASAPPPPPPFGMQAARAGTEMAVGGMSAYSIGASMSAARSSAAFASLSTENRNRLASPTSASQKKKRSVREDAMEEAEEAEESDEDEAMGFGLFDHDDAMTSAAGAYCPTSPPATQEARFLRDASASPSPPPPPKDVLHALIDLQTFAGAWLWTQELFALLGTQPSFSSDGFGNKDAMATALTMAFLRTKMAGRKDVWEMVTEKARAWLGGQIGDGKVEEIVKRAEGLL